MKTLLARLKHHPVTDGKKIEIYLRSYMKLKPKYNFTVEYHKQQIIKNDSIEMTNRYLRRFGKCLK